MLLGVKKEIRVDRLGRTWKHDVFTLKCDMCGKEFERRGCVFRFLSRKTHACSSECKSAAHKNGGVVERIRAKTNLERYGAENAYAAEPCKTKIKSTLMEHYGVEHALQSVDLQRKQHETSVARYGERPISSPIIQERIKATMLERHGVERPMQMVRVREAMMSGSIEKYGVPFPMQSPEFKHEMFERRTEDGTYFKSKSEDRCFDALCERFGMEWVDRQVAITKHWCIDFYVRSIDVYVQFDGVYWHALDRPIEEIRRSGTDGHRRDMSRYRKWLVDRQQEKWFVERGLRLVRITDKEFQADPTTCLLRIIGAAAWLDYS